MSDLRDEASFEALYRKHSPRTKPWIRAMLDGTGIDWEATHSQGWTDFYHKYCDPRFPFQQSPDHYMRSCLHNAAMDRLREFLREEQPVGLGDDGKLLPNGSEPIADQIAQFLQDLVEGEEQPSSPPLQDPARWSDPALAEAVMKLPPQQRAVILFWAWREPPPTDREIGEEFNIKRETAKTHRRLALNKLKRSLGAPLSTSTTKAEESK
uniref:sigma-70 family RNA polymerase sigma factor n=1 Tax=Nonomuraea sp. CA-252377 TaxID=3240003 RepID=UPI003F494362